MRRGIREEAVGKFMGSGENGKKERVDKGLVEG